MVFGHFNRLLAAMVALAGMSAMASGAAAADIVKQFSLAGNPHAPWAYQGGADLSSEAPLPTKFNAACFNQFPHTACWWSGGGIPTSRSVFKNLSRSSIHWLTIVLPPDHLGMDPENGAVSVQWTAPAAGNYRITGNFLGIDTGQHAHPVQITSGAGASLFTQTISAYGQKAPFDFKVTLAKGQAVNFAVLVGPNGDYAYLSTGLAGTITKVP